VPGSFGTSDSDNGAFASTKATDKVGVFGSNEAIEAPTGGGAGGAGVFGLTQSLGGAGVFGANNTTEGVGVQGNANSVTFSSGAGVWGHDAGFGPGVKGTSTSGHGVSGATSSQEKTGVVGANSDNSAFGSLGGFLGSLEREPIGVFGANYNLRGYAGFFAGNVTVTGVIRKAVSHFRIDHPLDPANKWLDHSAVESAEMKNIYDGTVVLDAHGQALVELPAWFEALNRDFRYQLTAVGVAAPNLHVAEEIFHNRFRIAGGGPGSKVCWQVSGVRHDPYARAHPIHVEPEKAPGERGSYLYPQGYGMPAERALHAEMRRRFEQRATRSESADVS
jgi:hypothetical protein